MTISAPALAASLASDKLRHSTSILVENPPTFLAEITAWKNTTGKLIHFNTVFI